MSYNITELEAVGLCVAVEAINDMANRALLDVPLHFCSGQELDIRYRNREHQQLFLIRLLDFVKESGDSNLTGVRGSCLQVLQQACACKALGGAARAMSLESATIALDTWLRSTTTFQMWLPTLNVNALVTVERETFLYILGNYAKHNLSRLTGISRELHRMLQSNGYQVPLEQMPLAIEDFREHLQENYFVYYGTWLAELVNNLRWGIQDYLQETYQWAYIRENHPSYSYRYPAAINNPIAQQWFWRLMNHIRDGPYIGRFEGSRHLKRDSLI